MTDDYIQFKQPAVGSEFAFDDGCERVLIEHFPFEQVFADLDGTTPQEQNHTGDLGSAIIKLIYWIKPRYGPGNDGGLRADILKALATGDLNRQNLVAQQHGCSKQRVNFLVKDFCREFPSFRCVWNKRGAKNG